MKNILVPVGTSTNVTNLIQYAIDFAQDFGAKLYLVQIFDVYSKAGTIKNIDQILKEDSLRYMNSLIDQVDKKQVEVEIHAFKGDLIDTLELACDALNIDLLLVEPRTNSKKETEWLGKTSGKIIKRSNLPVLIVPVNYSLQPIKKVLFGLKNAAIRKEDVLNPIIEIKNHFDSKIDLLLVKTPFHNEGDFDVPEQLSAIVDHSQITENATTFQGILEYFQATNPDLITVVRRNRGAFSKLWEKNTISKTDFNSPVPVLVLSGMK